MEDVEEALLRDRDQGQDLIVLMEDFMIEEALRVAGEEDVDAAAEGLRTTITEGTMVRTVPLRIMTLQRQIRTISGQIRINIMARMRAMGIMATLHTSLTVKVLQAVMKMHMEVTKVR